MNVIAIIPARGGSKGIPRKNIKEFCGKPLIAHIIETALKVKELDRVVVSTEDKEIAEIAKKYGAEIPFLRPEELARDEIPTVPVLQHAVRYLEEEEGYRPDIIVLLYATSPLLDYEKISGAIKMIKEGNFDSIVSVVEDTMIYWIEKNGDYKRLYPKILKNRQYLRPLLRANGAIFICTRDLLMGKSKLIGEKRGFLKMQKIESVDINEPTDFEIAEFLMKKRKDEKR